MIAVQSVRGGGSAAPRAPPSCVLPRPAAGEHGVDGLQEDDEVEAEAPVLDVLTIEPEHVVESQVAPARDLPQPGDARCDPETAVVMGVVAFHLPGQRRPGSDHAHVAPEHVDELGELVQAPGAQEGAHPGHPGVVPHLEEVALGFRLALELCQPLLGVVHHGAELEHLEVGAVASHPLLAE